MEKMRSMMLLLLLTVVMSLANISDAQDYCGDAVYNGTEGTIYSPWFFLGGYGPGNNCSYSVRAQDIRRISLTFRVLDLELQTNCSYDWVQITCVSHEIELPRRFCGTSSANETVVLSPCSDVRIDFRTDSTISERGFAIDYEVSEIECFGNCTPVSNSYGYICPCDTIEPNSSLPTARPSSICQFDCFPSSDLSFCICRRPYRSSTTPSTCPPGCYSTTDFNGYPTCNCDDTTTPLSTTCPQGCYRTTDFQGNPYCNCPSSTDSPLLCPYGCYADADYWGNRFCRCPQSTQPSIWCSPGCTSEVDTDGSRYCNCPTTTLPPCVYPCYYSWDYSYDFAGRRFCYCPTTTTNPPPTGCNQTLTAIQGVVMSPNYPNMYTRGVDCTQNILVPFATSIKLKLIDININYYDTYTCSYEYIEITGCDGSFNIYCTANSFPSTGLIFHCTDSPLVTINFHSSLSSYYGYRGFKLTYSAIVGLNCSDSALYLSAGGTGVLTSPNFPNNFPTYSECYNYLFTDDDNVRVMVTFEQLRLEETTNCERVSLRLTCQDNSSAGESGSFREEVCGNRIPAATTFNCRVLQIWFKSNSTSAMSPRGFKMRFYGMSTRPSTVDPLVHSGALGKDADLPQSSKIGIGLGVGVGGFFLLILIVIIIVVVFSFQRQMARRERRHLEDLAVICRNLNGRAADAGGSLRVWRSSSVSGGLVNPIHGEQQRSSEQLPSYNLATGSLSETSSVGGFIADQPKSQLIA